MAEVKRNVYRITYDVFIVVLAPLMYLYPFLRSRTADLAVPRILKVSVATVVTLFVMKLLSDVRDRYLFSQAAPAETN